MDGRPVEEDKAKVVLPDSPPLMRMCMSGSGKDGLNGLVIAPISGPPINTDSVVFKTK